jgi:PAS domain S-box-containing protein
MGLGISLYLPHLRLEISRKIPRLLKGIIFTVILVISLVLSLPANAYAEETQPQFYKIRVDDGLSQSCVLAILQDREGLIWFGTQDGLNKYDGYNFTVYKYNERNSKSLSDNFILSLYEDQSGTIWVGTQSGGLNKFDRQTEQFTHYTHDPNNPTSLGNNTVWSIYEDKLGTLWVGTDGGGLNRFNRETEQFIHYTHKPDDRGSLSNNTVLSIYEDKFRILWVGTGGGGLNQFNRETEQFTHYIYNPSTPGSLSHDTVLSIYEDHSDRLWIGTNGGGLNKFERKTGQFTNYIHDPDNSNSLSDNTVSSIVEDQVGNLWLTTSSWYGNSYGTALDQFDPETNEFTHYTHNSANPNSLNENTVASILRDKSEILWIGTGFSGINKLDTKDPKFLHYKHAPADPNSLIDNHISSIYESKNGSLWIGTYNRGLDKLDRSTGQFTPYTHEPDNPNSLSSDNIWAVYEDQYGVLWIGTLSGGLNKLDLKTEKFTLYKHDPDDPNSLSDDTVWSICEDQSDNLWIGTFKGGLNKFNRKTGQFTDYTHDFNNPKSLSDNNVFSIYEDKLGTLWIGTVNGGLNKFDPKTGEFTHYIHNPNNPNSLSYDRVLSMLEYPAGTLWIGTYGGGLDKFDIATETFTHYTEKDGLPSNSVVGILSDDDGNLWLSTGKGLSKFNPKSEKFRNYDVSDGLQGNEFDGVKAYLKTKDGEMFFGGLNGFNAFYPEQVKDNPHIPPIVITDFKIFDKSVKLDSAISEAKEIKLSYKANFFGFEFAALDYTNPKKNQYAYKLEGFDKDWIYSGSRRYATYTNLDGGAYTFRVKGSNNDGVWNEEGTSIKIIITPPPWKTWWAYTVYAVALVSAVLGYVQWKTRAQAKENALLRENERKLHQFLEAIPLGINVIDTAGKVVYINQTALKLYGRESSSDASLDNCYAIAPQLYIAGTEQQYPLEDLPLIRALKGEKTSVDDLEIDRSHQRIPVEALATPIYDEYGTIVYAIVAFQDITARKQAEAERRNFITALQQTKDRLQAVLDTVPGCIAWISCDGRYLGVNQYLVDTFNLSPKNFVGKEVGFAVKDSLLTDFISQFLASSEVTASQVIELPFNGSTRNYLITIQKYRQNTAAVWVGIDITERVQAEDALRGSLREKEVLLQEVHHRVKNNLQIVSSLLDLQSQNLTESTTQKIFQDCYNRIRSMALIHEKLYESTSLSKINFAEYVEALVSYLALSYGISDRSVNMQLKVEPIYLNIDTAIPCGLIINELVSNALKYAFSDDKPGLLKVELYSAADIQEFILVIKDNGVGISKDFNTQETATLGLQLVKILTHQLDGSIELNVTEGTEFKIRFNEVRS